MKKIVLLSVLLSFAFITAAQDSLSFLTSKSAMRAYAVDRARQVELQISGQTETQFPTYPVISLPAEHTSADIIRAVTNTSVQIRVANLRDEVYLWALVMDTNGDFVFYAYGAKTPTLVNNHYVLPKYNVTLVQYPLRVQMDRQVASAEMWITDPLTGETVQVQQLSTWNNNIWFDPTFAGQGYLHVTFRDGTQRIYDLRNGGRQTTGEVLVGNVEATSIENLVSLNNPAAVADVIVSINSVGNNKTYEVTTYTNQSINFTISTTEGARPIGFWMRKNGAGDWTFNSSPNYPTISVPFGGPGTWYVVPEWNPNQFREPNPPIYNGGGGRG